MGYYHILLSPNSRKLCTIVLPFRKFECVKLPMGLCNSPDIFQEKMSELFQGFEYVRAYKNDIFLIKKNKWDDHLEKLETVLNKLAHTGLKVKAEKSFFGQSECEYLGFWINRDGIRPLSKKVDAIKSITPPKSTQQIC